MLAQTHSGVAYSVKQPVTFGVAGLRYQFSPVGRLQPNVSAGFGMAKVTQDVTFTVAGTDVTGTLQQFGVTLGSDLTGSSTKPMITIGAGASLPVGRVLVIDFQYRYGRVSATDRSINISRAGRVESWAIPAEVARPLIAELQSGRLAPKVQKSE